MNGEGTAEMETEWRIARERLWEHLREDRQASHRALAKQLGYSVTWVRKWRKRLEQAAPGDERALNSQSHRPKTNPRRVSPQVEHRIIELRVALSEQYHRRAGARTIAAYLRQEAATLAGVVPTSSATI